MIAMFNMTSSAMDLFVNHGQVQAPDKLEPGTGYRTYPKSVGLQNYPEPQVFGLGANSVTVRYKDFSPPLPAEKEFMPNIPDSVRTDFIIFLFANRAVLLRTSGEEIESYSWPIS